MRATTYDLNVDTSEGVEYKAVRIHGGGLLFFKVWIEQPGGWNSVLSPPPYCRVRMEFVPPSRVPSIIKETYMVASGKVIRNKDGSVKCVVGRAGVMAEMRGGGK